VQKLAAETGTALIWITHDLTVVASLADRVAVMYAGRIVETGTTDEVIDSPRHPYTVGLIGSVPSHNKRGEPLAQIPGMTPSMVNLPEGCAFRPRCPRDTEACRVAPELTPVGGALARCHHPHVDEVAA
ncbi:MAG: oligopeptide/dipeptide ABC transporter ATP-binding protein, partial [Pseudomonadota bacterium]